MPHYLGDATFITAIARGWGLTIRCGACRHEQRWSDNVLAEKFIDRLDDQVSSIAKRLKCMQPGCAGGETVLSFYNAGTFDGAVSETPASIEAREKKLREMAQRRAVRRPMPGRRCACNLKPARRKPKKLTPQRP